jgi:uncharacterized hydrophobic protein (TIGR00271 family)
VLVPQPFDRVHQVRCVAAHLLEEAVATFGLRDVRLENFLEVVHRPCERRGPTRSIVARGRGDPALDREDRVVEPVPSDAHVTEDVAVPGLNLFGRRHGTDSSTSGPQRETLGHDARGGGRCRSPSILACVIQLRIISPAHLTDTVVMRLREEPGVTNVTVHVGSAVQPVGDLVVADVARERGNAMIEDLVGLGLEELGSISLQNLEATKSRAVDAAELAALGHGADAIIWEHAEEDAQNDARFSVTYLVLMALAALIASVGVLVDSAVLIIGAMIVGPEYGPLNAISVAVHRRRSYGTHAALKLAFGLVLAVATAASATAIFRLLDQVPHDFETSDRFFTSFVSEPNVFSVVVAIAAGIVGTIALAQGRPTALAGVLVSVTTIPAAAALGVDLVFADWDDAGGAAAQLLINIVAIVCGSVTTLVVHDRAWRAAVLRRTR